MYGIRDATGSVEAIPLIVSSILSKKLAAGLGGLVMDVKHGNGAFMSEYEDAKALARALVDVAVAAGLPTVALLTDMNQVLGATAGNALEVRESIEILKDPGNGDPCTGLAAKIRSPPAGAARDARSWPWRKGSRRDRRLRHL